MLLLFGTVCSTALTQIMQISDQHCFFHVRMDQHNVPDYLNVPCDAVSALYVSPRFLALVTLSHLCTRTKQDPYCCGLTWILCCLQLRAFEQYFPSILSFLLERTRHETRLPWLSCASMAIPYDAKLHKDMSCGKLLDVKSSQTKEVRELLTCWTLNTTFPFCKDRDTSLL